MFCYECGGISFICEFDVIQVSENIIYNEEYTRCLRCDYTFKTTEQASNNIKRRVEAIRGVRNDI